MLWYDINNDTYERSIPMFEIIFGVFAAIFALIFVAMGVVALIGGVQQRRRCSASAAGTVSAVHSRVLEKGKRKVNVYTPEFKFEAGGHTYTMRSSFTSMRREFKEGQAVTIRYDPADPKVAYVSDDTNNSSRGGIMCVCFGLMLAIAAVALFT